MCKLFTACPHLTSETQFDTESRLQNEAALVSEIHFYTRHTVLRQVEFCAYFLNKFCWNYLPVHCINTVDIKTGNGAICTGKKIARLENTLQSIMEPLQDPLGNNIMFSSSFGEENLRNAEELSMVITKPAFIIKVHKDSLYFFRLVQKDLNLLIETIAGAHGFIAVRCVENPTVDYISGLLQRGALISFLT